MTSLYFPIDLISVFPFELLGGNSGLLVFPMMKLLSIWKVRILNQHSEMMKVVFKLLSLMLALTIYLNFSTCLIYYTAEIDKKWTPPVAS